MLKVKFNFRKMVAIAICLASTIMFSGCNKDEKNPGEKEPEGDGSTTILVVDNSSLTQDVYADNIESNSGVSFTTTGAWTSSISEITASSQSAMLRSGTSPSWISISPDRGNEAGTYTIAIALETNYSGADRTAIITVSCNGKKIEISVTQKGVKKDGKKPEVPRLISLITENAVFNSDYYSSGYAYEVYKPLSIEFTYDNSFRIKEMYKNNNKAATWSYDISGEVRITTEGEHDRNTYRALLNSSRNAHTIKWGTSQSQGEVSLSYNADGYLTDYNLTENDYGNSWCYSLRLIWNNGNITTFQGKECTEQAYQNISSIAYSQELNNKTTIDPNELFFNVIGLDSYDPLFLFSMSGFTGKRSKNYQLNGGFSSSKNDNAMKMQLYTEATEPAIGSEWGIYYDREFYGNAVWSFDSEDFPATVKRQLKVTKTELFYNGAQREYVEPQSEGERQWWTEQFGQGPWFYLKNIQTTNRETVAYDTYTWSIGYNR